MWGFLRHAADLILRPQVLTCSTSTCNNEINTVATSLWPSSILKTLKMTLISLCDIYQVFYKRFIFYVSASILTNAKTCIPGTPARHPRWRPPAVTYFMHTSCQSVSLGSISFFEKNPKKHRARGAPAKTRYSGHQNSRLMRDRSKHSQTKQKSNFMREGWKSKSREASKTQKPSNCDIFMVHTERLVVYWTTLCKQAATVRTWTASNRKPYRFQWTLSIVWIV